MRSICGRWVFAAHESPEGGEYFTSELLLKVWLYGYFKRLRSTRLLESGCRNEVGLIWLCGTQAPDHNTLWRFFAAHKKALRALFTQSVRVALRLDLVGLALQAIDGTKIQARCSGRQVFDEKCNRRLLAALEEAIAQQEQALEAAERDAAPLPAAELPAPLRAAQALRAQVAAALGEMAKHDLKHCHPQEPEARRMGCDGRNRFSYNAQVTVDAQVQVIVAAEVLAQENDYGLLVPMAEAARENTGAAVPSVADGVVTRAASSLPPPRSKSTKSSRRCPAAARAARTGLFTPAVSCTTRPATWSTARKGANCPSCACAKGAAWPRGSIAARKSAPAVRRARTAPATGTGAPSRSGRITRRCCAIATSCSPSPRRRSCGSAAGSSSRSLPRSNTTAASGAGACADSKPYAPNGPCSARAGTCK
jgi:transposase